MCESKRELIPVLLVPGLGDILWLHDFHFINYSVIGSILKYRKSGKKKEKRLWPSINKPHNYIGHYLTGEVNDELILKPPTVCLNKILSVKW